MIKMIQASGGVTILYRKALQKSPAYKTFHLEIEKAMSQGIRYRENTNRYLHKFVTKAAYRHWFVTKVGRK